MLSFQGYFDAGRFISPGAAAIPEHKRAIVTIQDDTLAISNGEAWDKFLNALDFCDEEVPAEFEQVTFTRVAETGNAGNGRG
jgi:hypothetical protein